MNNIFCTNLKKLRKEQGLLQKELAEDLHVSPTNICHWEKGSYMPEASKLSEIALYFNISLDELLGLEPIKKEQLVFPSLSEEENELLETYRNADEADKEFMLSLARRFQSQELQEKFNKDI